MKKIFAWNHRGTKEHKIKSFQKKAVWASLFFTFFQFLIPLGVGATDLNNWQYKSEVIVKNTKTITTSGNTFSDVVLNEKNFDFNLAKTDGSDIRFADEQGNQLDFSNDYYTKQGPVSGKYACNNASREAFLRLQGPSAVYHQGRTYVVYQGGDGTMSATTTHSNDFQDPFIVYYDHKKGEWSDPAKIGENQQAGRDPGGSADYPDSHGAPSIRIDSSNYLHVYWGAHTSSIQAARSSNPIPTNYYRPPNITNWTLNRTIQSSSLNCKDSSGQWVICGQGYQKVYPSVGEDKNGKVHLFSLENRWVEGKGNKRAFVVKTSSDKGVTFSDSVVLVQFNDSNDDFHNVYTGLINHDSSGDYDNFHVSFVVINADDNLRWQRTLTDCSGGSTTITYPLRQNIYYSRIRYNTSGYKHYNASGYVSLGYNSPITQDNDTSFRVKNNYGSQTQYAEPQVVLNSLNEPIITYNYRDTAGKYFNRAVRWDGTAWIDSSGMNTETNEMFNSAATFLNPSNELITYVAAKDNTPGFNPHRGGEIIRYKSINGGSTWTYDRTVMTGSDIGQGLYDPIIPANITDMFSQDLLQTHGKKFESQLEVLFYEWEECYNENKKIYAYGKAKDGTYEPLSAYPKARFRVRLPAGIAPGGTLKLYVYYGNDQAPSPSYFGSTTTMDYMATTVQNHQANQPVQYYTLSTSVTPSATGSIQKTPNQSSYLEGANVNLVASAYTGYSFKNWSGCSTSTIPEISVVMNSNNSCTANFDLIAIDDPVTPSCTINANPGLINPGDPLDLEYTTHNSASAVLNWSIGEVSVGSGQNHRVDPGPSVDRTYTMTVTSTTAHTANCSANVYVSDTNDPTINFYNLVTAVSPTGLGSIQKNPIRSIYEEGTTVSLTATGNSSGYSFSNWSGDCQGLNNVFYATMNSNKSCVANFVASDITTTNPSIIHPETNVGLEFLSFPSGVSGINIDVVENLESPNKNSAPQGSVIIKSFTIKASDQEGKEITGGFDAKITFPYENVDNLVESSYIILYWDGHKWSDQGISQIEVDSSNNKISFNTNHFTEFSVLGVTSENLPPVGTDPTDESEGALVGSIAKSGVNIMNLFGFNLLISFAITFLMSGALRRTRLAFLVK